MKYGVIHTCLTLRVNMEEKKQVKTIRFTDGDLIKINQFLEQNPGMDFSTLIRISINRFIEDPKLNQVPLVQELKEKKIWN